MPKKSRKLSSNKSHEISKEELENVRKCIASGMNWRKIKKELHIGSNRLSKIYRLLRSEQTGRIEPPPPTDQEIINSASRKAVRKISTTLSEQILKDYIGSMNAGKIIRSAEMRYRKAVENMGWNWEHFVNECLEYGYEKAVELNKLEALVAF
jgi:hypothetical protein